MKGYSNLHKEYRQTALLPNKDFSEIKKLVEQYEDMLYNLCFRLTQNMHDAQDLYQQTWLKAISKAALYKNKSIKNWLYTICLNLYRDNYRRNKRKQQIVSSKFSADAYEKAIQNATDNETTENAAIRNINNRLLLKNIEQLSDKLRVPIILHYFENVDYKSIAQMMRIPIGTVKSRLNLAKNQLREAQRLALIGTHYERARLHKADYRRCQK